MGVPGYWLGKKLSNEHIEKLNNFKLGHIPWNKDKCLSKEHIQKLRDSHLGKSNPHIGVPWSKQSREKVGKTLRRKYTTGEIIVSEKERKRRSKQMIYMMKHKIIPSNDTKIEILMEKELINRNINYIKQWKYELGIADFFLPKENIVIECDGIHWHTMPEVVERDKRKNKYFKDNNYKLYRFTDKEVLSNVKRCINKIKELKK